MRAPRSSSESTSARRGLGVGEREHRRGDDAALVVEAPVLLEPAVERGRGSPSWPGCRRAAPPRRRTRASGTAARAPRPCSSITARRWSRSWYSARSGSTCMSDARVDALGDLAAEERIEAARHDDRVEGRVRDEPVHLAAHQQLHPLAVLHRLHAAVAELRVEVPGEGVERLVVVVVGVDRPGVHGAPPGRPVVALSDSDSTAFRPRRRRRRRCRRARRRARRRAGRAPRPRRGSAPSTGPGSRRRT